MSLEFIIALVLFGIVLMIAEAFVPGGILGSIGAVSLLVAVIAAFSSDQRRLGAGLLTGIVIGGPILAWALVKYVPRTRLGRRMLLTATESDWTAADTTIQDLVGKKGAAQSPLRPAGIALIAGRRINVVTQGEMIRRGRPVEVIEVEGNRVVVAEITENTPSGRKGGPYTFKGGEKKRS